MSERTFWTLGLVACLGAVFAIIWFLGAMFGVV